MALHFDIGHGMRGYYAMLRNNEEVIQTGIGSYNNPFDAYDEAISWARSEGADAEVWRILEMMAQHKNED